MPDKKLIVPEAKRALYKFKMESANEFEGNNPKNSPPKHTDVIVRELIRMGEEKLIDKE